MERFITLVFLFILIIFGISTYNSKMNYYIEDNKTTNIIENDIPVSNIDEDIKEEITEEQIPEEQEINIVKPNTNDEKKDSGKSITPPITSSPTTSVTENQKEEVNNNIESQTEIKEEVSNYIGVPNPKDFYYSYHHGKIEYDSIDDCINDGIEISLIDTVDIINTNCIDVIDGIGNVLGEYLYINCKSGNCNKYKK